MDRGRIIRLQLQRKLIMVLRFFPHMEKSVLMKEIQLNFFKGMLHGVVYVKINQIILLFIHDR